MSAPRPPRALKPSGTVVRTWARASHCPVQPTRGPLVCDLGRVPLRASVSSAFSGDHPGTPSWAGSARRPRVSQAWGGAHRTPGDCDWRTTALNSGRGAAGRQPTPRVQSSLRGTRTCPRSAVSLPPPRGGAARRPPGEHLSLTREGGSDRRGSEREPEDTLSAISQTPRAHSTGSHLQDPSPRTES